MAYYLFKLKFPGSVHFGTTNAAGLSDSTDTFSADKFFSAMCIASEAIYGNNSCEKLRILSEDGTFLLSNLMPYKDYSVYIPRPQAWISSSAKKKESSADEDRKALKKIKYIPIEDVGTYFSNLKAGKKIEYDNQFGRDYSRTNVRISFADKPMPYTVGTFTYAENCGLAFILKCDETDYEYFLNLIEFLGYEGIGGRRSSGLGKYEILLSEPINEDCNSGIYNLLTKESSLYINISDIIPTKDEISVLKNGNCTYSVIRRGGFIYSDSYTDGLVKKNAVGMVVAGSCFDEKIYGRIAVVANNGNHPIYRYGKGMFIGVEL